MSILSRFSHWMQRSLKTSTYLKKKSYVVRYQVMVRNTSPKANELTIVVPVPSDRDNQTLASPPRFTPTAERVGKEAKYGNQFALWGARLAPGESRIFTEHFSISVSPVDIKMPTDALLSQYPAAGNVFCAPTPHIQAADPQIIALAKEAAQDATDVGTVLMRFNDFVINRLEYGNPIKGLHSASDAIKHVKTDCGGFSSLFAALCIASGIPARIVSGFWAGYEKNDMHAWVEVQLPGGIWVPADPSTEYLMRQNRTRKFGKLGAIGSDRVAFSIGCDIPLEMFKKPRTVDILQHPFVQASGGDASFIVETRVETTSA
jgi:transglutaminase-like putative cysteine protease